jgi:hypothetical protein
MELATRLDDGKKKDSTSNIISSDDDGNLTRISILPPLKKSQSSDHDYYNDNINSSLTEHRIQSLLHFIDKVLERFREGQYKLYNNESDQYSKLAGEVGKELGQIIGEGNYESEYVFTEGLVGWQALDFALPKQKIGIEMNGPTHYLICVSTNGDENLAAVAQHQNTAAGSSAIISEDINEFVSFSKDCIYSQRKPVLTREQEIRYIIMFHACS